ncbi:hypothetical protein Tco_0431024 [Tanacetum coccineum]
MMLPSPSSLTLAIKAKGHKEEDIQILSGQLLIYLKSQNLNHLRKDASRILNQKISTISIADIIIPGPDVALELGKSISLIEVAEEEVARRSFDPPQKLKGVQSLTPEEQEVVDTMQALKESKKTSRRQPGVPDEEKVTSKEKVILERGSEQESDYTEEDQGDDEEVDWIDSDEDDEKKDDVDDDKSIDLEMTDDEETDDEFVQGDEQVNDDEDEEMTNAKVEESGKGDEENTDAAKTDAGKTKEVKDDAKKVELPPTSSSLSVSSVQETPLETLVTNLPPSSVSTIPHVPQTKQQEQTILQPPIITESPTITTSVPKSDALTVVQLRVAKLEKDVSELNKIDLSAKALATLKS